MGLLIWYLYNHHNNSSYLKVRNCSITSIVQKVHKVDNFRSSLCNQGDGYFINVVFDISVCLFMAVAEISVCYSVTFNKFPLLFFDRMCLESGNQILRTNTLKMLNRNVDTLWYIYLHLMFYWKQKSIHLISFVEAICGKISGDTNFINATFQIWLWSTLANCRAFKINVNVNGWIRFVTCWCVSVLECET